MTEPVKIGTNRLKNGRFAKGNIANPNGRPKSPEREELRQALEIAQKGRKKSFLVHFVERAYINDNVAIALAKKLLPDKIQGEGLANGVFVYVIRDAKSASGDRIDIPAALKSADNSR